MHVLVSAWEKALEARSFMSGQAAQHPRHRQRDSLRNSSARYTIGTLARQVGGNLETVRYYQRRGLMGGPARPLGGIRRYGQEHARRLRFIKEAQKLGFDLAEISELHSLEDGLHCREVDAVAGHKLATVRERMVQLARIENVLAVLVGKRHNNKGKLRCPLISSLEGARS